MRSCCIYTRPPGDFDPKPYVSGDADCSTTQLFGDEDYVLLACDGFFDAVKPSAVPDLVLDALRQPGNSEEGGETQLKQSKEIIGLKVAQQLVSHAKEAGSSDNITVMVVFLRPPEQLLSQDSTTGTAQATQDSTSQNAPQQ
ncbi:protein phosphatase 1F [Lates japonicus]|uniref:Protein phosphatase 1F n=1 Tax=Lates japonicus TaxID=270547 RepID=A0AAD3R6F5_LATJO|nr:protein phosphatase 1F [Lates japonicus]